MSLSTTAAEGMKAIRKAGGVDCRPAWEVAEALGLKYSGDCNLEHGGFFYDPSDWLENGYANAVSVDISDGCVFVDIGTINRTNVDDALRSCGWKYSDGSIVDDSGRVIIEAGEPAGRFALIEIESCALCWGIEQDETCGLLGVDPTGMGAVFKITAPDCNSEFFTVAAGRRVPVDNLAGFVVREYVIPYLCNE